jgi:hypothetical protein
MILYVNGDSHSGGCEAVRPECFLSDNWPYYEKLVNSNLIDLWGDEIRWAPTPENVQVSYGQVIADKLSALLHCHARGAGSNDRIIRTTKEYLKTHKPDVIIIGWSTFEREEWYNEHDNIWYQVNASGHDYVPEKWRNRYKDFIINVNWNEKAKKTHEDIWLFHQYLKSLSIPHLFFNSHNYFWGFIDQYDQYDWGDNFIKPYDWFSYTYYLEKICKLPRPKNNHYDLTGHQLWAEFLMPYLTKIL